MEQVDGRIARIAKDIANKKREVRRLQEKAEKSQDDGADDLRELVKLEKEILDNERKLRSYQVMHIQGDTCLD